MPIDLKEKHAVLRCRGIGIDGDTFTGHSRIHLAAFPPKERCDNWTELYSQAAPLALIGLMLYEHA